MCECNVYSSVTGRGFSTFTSSTKCRDVLDLLETIVNKAASITEASCGCVLLISDNPHECVRVVATGEARRYLGTMVSVNKGVCGQVWQTGRVVLINEYKKWVHRDPSYEKIVEALLYLPLKCGGEVVGVIGLWHTEPGRRFRAEDAEILEQFAVFASIAYENARLCREAQKEIAERKAAETLQAAVYQISETVSLSTNLDELYRAVHKIIAGLIAAQNLFIALYDSAINAVNFVYYADEQGKAADDHELLLAKQVISSGQPLLAVAQQRQGRRLNKASIGTGNEFDWLGIPLKSSENKVFGVLGVQTYGNGLRYEAKDKDILTFVSSQVAMAIERKRAEEALRESEEKYRAIVENTHDCIFIYRGDKLIYVNDQMCRQHGAGREIIYNKSILDFVHPDDRVRLLAYALQRASGDSSVPDSYEAKVITHSGQVRLAELRLTKISFGGTEAVFGVIKDIMDRVLQTAIYQISETTSSSPDLDHLYRSVHQIIGELIPAKNIFIALYEKANHTIQFPYYVDECDGNPGIKEFRKGLTEYVINTGKLVHISPKEHAEMVERGDIESVGSPAIDWLGVPLKRANNEVVGVLAVQTYTPGEAYTDKDKEILSFVSTQVAMAIERKRAEERLRFLSMHDDLTGLYNRAYFEEEANRLRDGRFGPIAVIMCDIDGLKLINDTLGHQAGDRILKKAANIIRQHICESDMAARIGGDEFAIVLTKTDEKVAKDICKRIQAGLQYQEDDYPMQISLSMGYAVKHQKPVQMEELIREADKHMYREKLHRSRSARSAIVQTVMKLLEARDFITEGHGDRLRDLTTELAKRIGMSEEQIADLRLLAQFHDIGKVGIPDRILFKPSSLTPEEKVEMQRHCEIGRRIAESSDDLMPIADWVLKHHEWWNGQGYPLGLKATEIPIQCRILGIADAYDAMTSDRPYRKAMARADAIAELERFSGIQFDPELVGEFIAIIGKE